MENSVTCEKCGRTFEEGSIDACCIEVVQGCLRCSRERLRDSIEKIKAYDESLWE